MKNKLLMAGAYALMLICVAVVLSGVVKSVWADSKNEEVLDAEQGIQRRTEAMHKIDASMLPLKEQLAAWQGARDLLEQDNNDDLRILNRHDYRFDWEKNEAILFPKSENLDQG